MVSGDPIRLPLRWQFIPVKDGSDGTIRWTWEAFTHTGEPAMKAERVFETFTECVAHARAAGYLGH